MSRSRFGDSRRNNSNNEICQRSQGEGINGLEYGWSSTSLNAMRSSFRSKQKQLPVKIRSIVRIRPLNKKERDDHIVMEIPPVRKIKHQKNKKKSERPCFPKVVLRPPPRTEHGPAFGSPEGTVRYCSNTQHDLEFHFDHVFREYATQDGDVFATIGRPMSLALMEPLFSSSKRSVRRNFVNIAVGTAGAGKTYMCFGSCNQNLKLKCSSDGLIPRMADSLFGQYQRLSSLKTSTNSDDKSSVFVLKISAFQVNQPKNPKNSSCEKGKLHDLLQHSSSKLPPKTKKNSSEHRSSSGTSSSESGGFSPSESVSLDGIEKSLYIDQDPRTHDFRVANAQVRRCRTTEEARDALQDVVVGIRKASNRRHECHVFVQLEPILVHAKTGDTIRKGGKIAFLDMAGFEDQSKSKSRNRFVSARLKDSIPNRCDAHAAVVHCLRSICFNELIRQGKNPTESDSTPRMAMETKHTAHKQMETRQVPFLQHKITMLLQPFFSPNQSDRTVVNMMLAVSSGHRDYTEKKELMTEIEALWSPFHPIKACVSTGLDSSDDDDDDGITGQNEYHSEKENKARKVERHEQPEPESEDEAYRGRKPLSQGVVKRKRRDAVIAIRRPSVTPSCADSLDDFSLPPPVAPPAPSLRPVEDLIRRASAPMEEPIEEEEPYERAIVPMSRTTPASDARLEEEYHATVIEDSSTCSSKGSNIEHRPLSHVSTRAKRNESCKKNYEQSKLKSSPQNASKKAAPTDAKRNRRQSSGDHCREMGKKKWSRKVEITTTTVEGPDDLESPLSMDHSQNKSIESVDELKHENEDLKRQNEELQEALKRLKRLEKGPRKSVSWRDCSNEKSAEYGNLYSDPPVNDQPPVIHKPGNGGAAAIHKEPTARHVNTSLLRAKMAKLGSSHHEPAVASNETDYRSRMLSCLVPGGVAAGGGGFAGWIS